MASKADRHKLYQASVQCVEAEIDFIDDTFENLRGRKARVLREDFCGTANTACEWLTRRPNNVAYGVDLDRSTLDWGLANNVPRIGERSEDLHLCCENVMTVKTPPCDAVLAMNFSYWIFKSRNRLRRYFRQVRHALADDGLLIMDCYGGSEAFTITKDRHKYNGFTYIWDQAAYNPITGEMRSHIHFGFSDGSRLDRAFTYDWRLWTLPEIQEILIEAGFTRCAVYWQGEDEDGDGDGDFKPTNIGEPDAAWIAYIVAEK